MHKTVNDFLVDFDTQRRTKYSEETKNKIVELKKSGLSIRKIAKKLNIPFGSIHYILRNKNEIVFNSQRPSMNYINRAEARYLYDMSDSSWDYYRGRYKHMFKKVGLTVWCDRRELEKYVIDKIAYKN